jgi:hypothetical protein
MPNSVLSFHHPLFCKDTPGLSKEMNMAPCVSDRATATGAKKKAKKGKPEGAAPAAVAQLPAAVAPMVTSMSPLTAATAAVSDPAPVNATMRMDMMTQPADLNGLLGQLRAQMAAEAAAKELLLQQALQAASQQQQQQQQNAAALLAQALAHPTNSNHYITNPIHLLQATSNNDALLQGMLSTLMGNSQLLVAPQQQQLQQQQHPQLHLQVPQQQIQLQIQQQLISLPQLNNNATVMPSQLASLASALSAGGINFGSAAPLPQQQPSQANILQALAPQHQLALLSQVTSSSNNATNTNN